MRQSRFQVQINGRSIWFATLKTARMFANEYFDTTGIVLGITKVPETDLQSENHGSIVMLQPLTRKAKQWLQDSCESESWQWFAGALAVEPRMVPDIVVGALRDGLVVA